MRTLWPSDVISMSPTRSPGILAQILRPVAVSKFLNSGGIVTCVLTSDSTDLNIMSFGMISKCPRDRWLKLGAHPGKNRSELYWCKGLSDSAHRERAQPSLRDFMDVRCAGPGVETQIGRAHV